MYLPLDIIVSVSGCAPSTPTSGVVPGRCDSMDSVCWSCVVPGRCDSVDSVCWLCVLSQVAVDSVDRVCWSCVVPGRCDSMDRVCWLCVWSQVAVIQWIGSVGCVWSQVAVIQWIVFVGRVLSQVAVIQWIMSVGCVFFPGRCGFPTGCRHGAPPPRASWGLPRTGCCAVSRAQVNRAQTDIAI